MIEKEKLAALRFVRIFEQTQRTLQTELKETAEKHGVQGMLHSGHHFKSVVELHLVCVEKLLRAKLEILLDVYYRDERASKEEDRTFLQGEIKKLFESRASVARSSIAEMLSNNRLPGNLDFFEWGASALLAEITREIEIKILENRIFYPDLPDKDISELLAMDEDINLEFKATFQWDTRGGAKNEELRLEVIRAIAAFNNTDGGFLFIGVDDSKEIYGLDKDYSLLRKSDRDGFCQLLTQEIENRLTRAFVPKLRITFHEISGRDICKIIVNAGNDAIWVKESRDENYFYIRTQNSTRRLSPKDAADYIRKKWPQAPS